MNNMVSQQNDSLNQTPLARTIDGVYRQRVYNHSNYSQTNVNSYPKINIKQESSLDNPASFNYIPANENQSIDGIYRQTPITYTDDYDNVQSKSAQEQPYKTESNINSQFNNGYTPSYRSYRPKAYSQSVDGIRNTNLRPNQYNNYNQLPYNKPAAHNNIVPQYNNQTLNQNYSNYNQPQTELHIPIATPTESVNHSPHNNLDNSAQTKQQNIHDQRSNYTNNNITKPKKITYLDVINTILLLSILTVAILILLKL